MPVGWAAMGWIVALGRVVCWRARRFMFMVGLRSRRCRRDPSSGSASPPTSSSPRFRGFLLPGPQGDVVLRMSVVPLAGDRLRAIARPEADSRHRCPLPAHRDQAHASIRSDYSARAGIEPAPGASTRPRIYSARPGHRVHTVASSMLSAVRGRLGHLGRPCLGDCEGDVRTGSAQVWTICRVLAKPTGAFESLAEPDSMSGWSACVEHDGTPAT